MTRGEQIETWQGYCCWERKNGGGAKRCTVQCAHCRSTRSTEKAEGREFASTLSDNRVHFAVIDGCLEVTFDGHDTTWGEALSEGDTREVVAMLAPEDMVSADWHGLTTILDTLYSADVFTAESGDPGARVVVLARKLAEVTERVEKAEAAARDFAEALMCAREALGWIAPWEVPRSKRASRNEALASAREALARHPEYGSDHDFLPGETGETRRPHERNA